MPAVVHANPEQARAEGAQTLGQAVSSFAMGLLRTRAPKPHAVNVRLFEAPSVAWSQVLPWFKLFGQRVVEIVFGQWVVEFVFGLEWRLEGRPFLGAGGGGPCVRVSLRLRVRESRTRGCAQTLSRRAEVH